jgi:transposase-like protein
LPERESCPAPRRRSRPHGETRRLVALLMHSGLTISQVAQRLDISKPTVCYHARKLGFQSSDKFNRRYDWAEVQRYYDEGHSITRCQEHFGFCRKTFWDAVLRGAVVTRPPAVPMEDLLVAGRRRSRTHVKTRLLSSGLKENRCDECGITDWRGRHLAMQLHHINGDGQDNRLTNIAFLCPNCHSQTPNYSGRNARRLRAA